MANLAGIHHGYDMLAETGAIEAFEIAAGRCDQPLRGYVFRDSDVYKWLEAASYALSSDSSRALSQKVELVIGKIADAQSPDGYVNTSFANAPRFTDLQNAHEIYCAGHLIQAGIAHRRCTSEGTLFNIAVRAADNLEAEFGEQGKLAACGHPVAEMALVELFRETGDSKYLALAKRMLDARGHGVFGGREYLQDHLPFAQQREAVGHAVRALYLYAGATDIYLENGDAEIFAALHTLWDDVQTKTYVTGGLGSRHEGEAFGEPHELPNTRAYAETCAAVASIQWNWRMFAATHECRYFDVLERALYNGFLSGGSRDGKSYFYVNPLASWKGDERKRWFDCACCPPNIYRTIASVQGMFGIRDVDGYSINTFDNIDFDDGEFSYSIFTNYPFGGDVRIVVNTNARCVLRIRIPEWAKGAQVRVGDELANASPGTFYSIDRDWKEGDEISVSLPFEVRLLRAHKRELENRGCAALARGPLVYCIEAATNEGMCIQDVEMDGEPRAEGNRIIFPGSDDERKGEIIAAPYHDWDNQGLGAMKVWIPIRKT